MTGWAVIWVLGVCAVAAAFANHRYHWAAGWRYNWTQARHLVQKVEREFAAENRWQGSMILAEERELHGPGAPTTFLPAPLAHEPDWREQTAADLSPEALTVLCAGCIGFEHCDGVEGACNCTCGWPADWAEPDDDDSGPGDSSSLIPGPDPRTEKWRDLVEDQGIDGANRVWPELDPERGGPGYERLADTADIMDAHLLADVQAFMRAKDAEAIAHVAQLRADLAAVLA